jgi:uncharacterized protein YraI
VHFLGKRGIATVLFVLFVLGMIFPSAVFAQQVQFTTPILVVNSSFLNVRTGPGVQYNVLITVVGGTELPVLGRANDNVWFQVSTVVGIGWVNAEFVLPRGTFENVPVVDASVGEIIAAGIPATIGLPNTLGQGGGGAAPSSVTTTGQGGGGVSGVLPGVTDQYGNPIAIGGPNERFRAVINVEAVDLRDQPQADARALITLYRDDTKDYPIVGVSRDRDGVEWFALIVPNVGTGWVEAPKVRTRLSAAFRTVISITARVIQLGDGPGTGSTRLPVLTEGDEGFLVNVSQDGRFVQIELGGGEVGWIPWEAHQTRTGTTTDGLNLNPAQFGTINTGFGDQGGGGTGVSTVVRPTLDQPHIIINTAFLNVRSGPGAQYTSIATVSGGTELAVLGIAEDRVWFFVQGTFGRGWVNNEFTLFRGVIDNVPVIRDFSGVLSAPTAIVPAGVNLFAAPGANFGAIGTIPATAELPVVARTADFVWVQVNTVNGFGWLLAEQVTLRGDTTLIPIAG